MQIKNLQIYQKAKSILDSLYGSEAQFREGQYEAIEATMQNRRVLVVQKTGWGKSLVYFVCTKILREKRKGVTVVVSPLLVLMQNQLEAATKLGLVCDVLNSTVKDRREEILNNIVNGKIDLVLVTPETLFAEDVQSQLKNIRIGLFVIDEAHCISDWGHDFRLNYGNLRKIIPFLPLNVPVLATTATANQRVVDDLEKQLGGNVYISRGPLTRESLSIQILHMDSKAERYAWILENITKLPGHGIIYCLTRRDCDYLSDFLQKNGVNVLPYYSKHEGEEENAIAIDAFQNNQIKAIVATVKLGMGYDKGDISFVIHFQMPSNIVAYYQQIGRAGRSIDRAYAILMCGKEDEDIINYFRETAFPTQEETLQIVDFISSRGGAKRYQLEAELNIKHNRLEKALYFLTNDGYLVKDRGTYRLTAKKFVYNSAHYQAITEIRRKETEQMKALTRTKDCYSKFIVNSLDDDTAKPCGHCTNCLGKEIFPSTVSFAFKEQAAQYINGLIRVIEPRKRWESSNVTKRTYIEFINQPGLCLSRYGEVGYGELVKRDKYSPEKRFCDELVGRSAELLRPHIQEKGITHITCVPSLRSPIVEDFTKRLAERCGIPFVSLLIKKPAQQQKFMENGPHQCANAFSSFEVKPGVQLPQKILLVDDIVDSRWTLTVCGYRLMEHGCIEVYPFALADSQEED